jgi:hypothetical protein
MLHTLLTLANLIQPLSLYQVGTKSNKRACPGDSAVLFACKSRALCPAATDPRHWAGQTSHG